MKKKLLMLLISGLLVWIIGSAAAMMFVCKPRPVKMPDTSKVFDLPVENVSLKTTDDVNIGGWYLPGDSTQAVVLTNGIYGNRRGLVTRAKYYAEKGFAVLLIDLRGTGESQAEPISFGWYERHDVLAAFQFLENKGYETVGVHGISLGASAVTYSLQESPDYDFVVLESCYDDMKNALNVRLDLYHVPRFCSGLMKYMTERRLGVNMETLRPLDYVPNMTMPTLFIAGDSEIKVKKTETESLFAQCGSTNKNLYFFKGAKHQDFFAYDEVEYKRILSNFLSRQ